MSSLTGNDTGIEAGVRSAPSGFTLLPEGTGRVVLGYRLTSADAAVLGGPAVLNGPAVVGGPAVLNGPGVAADRLVFADRPVSSHERAGSAARVVSTVR